MCFERCARMWYWQYIQKIPVTQETHYMDGGSVIHSVLQRYYSGELKNVEDSKLFFSKEWERYKLQDSPIAIKKENYWAMVLNGILLNKKITSTEFKIFFPEVVAFLDGINTEEGNEEIIDWKSSTRSHDNEDEYMKQLRLYSWLFYRKFNRIPKKATVYYLKNNGSKQELSFNFTEQDLKDAEQWYIEISKQMEETIAQGKLPNKCARCFGLCAFTTVCDNNEEAKFTLRLNGNYINVDGFISPLLQKGLERKFSYELKNAFYMKKANPFANTTIKFWNNNKQSLPLGFLKGLIKTLNDYAVHKNIRLNLNIVDVRKFSTDTINMPETFLNNIKLRDYQKKAVDIAIREKIGILQLPTGSGKTECLIEIIRQLNMPTLFVCEKVDLLRQTKIRLEKALGIEVGVIGHGEDIIKHVTVCTIQTLSRNVRKYADYLKNIRLAIFDECHHVSSRSYQRIAHYLQNSEYRISTTATPERDDGNTMAIWSVTGYPIFILDPQELINQGWLMQPDIYFVKNYMKEEEINEADRNSKSGLINETPNYVRYYENHIINNVARNNIIRQIVEKYKGKKILILAKQIKHELALHETIPQSVHLYGGTNKNERIKILENFNKENFVLISTTSIFSEGLDVPKLDLIINAGANAGSVKTVQMLGRVLRTAEGKKQALYYDFLDENRFFKRASYARKKAFYKQGYEVILIEPQNI
jgi:superfamily II DNA or RNA helicase